MLQGAENGHTCTTSTPGLPQLKRPALTDWYPWFSAGMAGLQQTPRQPRQGLFSCRFQRDNFRERRVEVVLSRRQRLFNRLLSSWLSLRCRRVYIHYYTITPIPYALCSFMLWIGRTQNFGTLRIYRRRMLDWQRLSFIWHLPHSWGDYSASALREPHMRNIEICPKSSNISIYSCIHVFVCPI